MRQKKYLLFIVVYILLATQSISVSWAQKGITIERIEKITVAEKDSGSNTSSGNTKAINKTTTKKKAVITKKKVIKAKKKAIKAKKKVIKVKKKTAFKPKLYIDKFQFSPDEKFNVKFKASSSYGDNAWVGMIPSTAPHGTANMDDTNDLDYKYLDKKSSGSFVFKAPKNTGMYDIRMYDAEFGKEVASIALEVRQSNGELWLKKKKYKVGEKIAVQFTAPPHFDGSAWVGVVKSKVPHGNAKENDAHDLESHYIEKRSNGVFKFNVYLHEGKYDFRMFDAKDGNEVSSVSFTIIK